MTEPPRPPGEDNPNDPTRPFNAPPGNEPNYGSTPPPPPPPPYTGGGYQPPPPPPNFNQPPPYGGYGQQPGGYGPPGGFGQPGNSAATEDKTWLLVAHFGGAAGMLIGGGTLGWVAPLIAMMARGNQSPYVRAESVKALNFQLILSIVATVCWVLSCLVITWLIAVAAMIVGIVFGVIAGSKANNGEPYNYPFPVNLVK